MDVLEKALKRSHPTIIYGHLGRYPALVQFYLDAVRELEPVSDMEPMFRYRYGPFQTRLVRIVVEPPFDWIVPRAGAVIVLSSHAFLSFDPATTRVLRCCPREREVPPPTEPCGDQTVVVPPTSHPFDTFQDPIRVDLSSCRSPHEAYLRLQTLKDCLTPDTTWSLSIPEGMRRALLQRGLL